MKKYHLLLIAISVISFASCKKYDGDDSYDFSNSKSSYIRFSPGQSLEINSETVDTFLVDSATGDTTEYYYYLEDESPTPFKIEIRNGFTEDINYTYTISSDLGDNTVSGTMAKQTLSSTEGITFTESDFDGISGEVISGQIKLESASGATVGDLTIGYPLPGDNTTIDFVANKPGVLHPKE